MKEGGVSTRMVEALERIATANEDLIRLATEERDARELDPEPPLPGVLMQCPHCQTLNPEIRNEGGVGSFAEFVLAALCMSCQHIFLAVPQGWETYKSKSDYEGRNNVNGS